MSLILSFTLALLLTAALLPLCLRYAHVIGLMDFGANARKVHKGLVPRSGGIAIVAGALAAALFWMPLEARHLALFAAVGLVVTFGFLDDRLDLSAAWKLWGQVLAAVLLVAAYGGFTYLPFMGIEPAPWWLCLPLTLVFLVGVTNAVNLSDGLDGLAAGNSLLSLILLALLAAQAGDASLVILALAITGGLLGFLRFNTHPAQIFMGDTGSQFLGFAAAALTVLVLQHDNLAVSPALPLLIFGLPILDTASVMAVRCLRGRPVLRADRSHLHHQFLRLGFRHYEAVIILYALQATSVGLAWWLRHEADAVVVAAYGGYCAVVLGFLLVARLGGWQVHAANGSTERRNPWLRKLNWYYHHSYQVIAAALGVFFLLNAFTLTPGSELAETGLLVAGGLAVTWAFFRNRSELVTRLIFFSVTAFLAYGFLMDPDHRPVFNAAVDLYLIVLSLALLLAMRMTRRNLFHLDSQDYLVLLIVAMVPFMPLEQFDQLLVARVALRVAVLLYACEFVLARGGANRNILNAAGLASLAAMPT